MNKLLFLFIQFALALCTFAQEKICNLPKTLAETSGLTCLNDSTFITINDSGNTADVYVFDSSGKILNTCKLTDTKNEDWEDICVHKEHLYIGDIGNNANKRKHLYIYKCNLNDVLNSKKHKPKQIKFNYPNQKKYPPKKTNLYFDAEALSFYNGDLWIFTKNRTEPFDGISKTYSISNNKGDKKAHQHTDIHLKPTTWLQDCVTASTIFKNKLYLLTYSKIYVYNIIADKLNWDKTIELSRFGQWEGLDCTEKGIYLTEESKFGIPAGLYFIAHGKE